MVGKGVDTKSSRIFQQCYVKCCKLQNLTPISSVIPSGSGKNLDFCVDRIKYNEWAPILNALICDLSLHSMSIKCRLQSKIVLENIDCDRLAKTVNKRAVILTRFMLTNLVEAIAQCLSNTSLLTSLLLDGLPLRVPYLNPVIDALYSNTSLQHLYLTKCYIGDAGCMGICKALRCLPNVLTLDLSSCDISSQGAAYIADLVKFQKIHRYSENWKQTLRYRLPELDMMSGLRRITLCGNTNLGDAGASQLMETLSDDLWIKALDLQCCGLTEGSAQKAKQLLNYNSTIVVLDLRHNLDIYNESMNAIRILLRQNEQGLGVQQYRWLSSTPSSYSESKSSKSSGLQTRNSNVGKERGLQPSVPYKYSSKVPVKPEKNYQEILEEQLQDEISHRQQLEELNLQLIDQMKQLKQQQIRIWSNKCEPFVSSGSEQSIETSVRSTEYSSGSDGSSFVPIDHNTLSYIQQAFKDIYSFIKTNQCQGKCKNEQRTENARVANAITYKEEVKSISEQATNGVEARSPKKSISTHGPHENGLNVKKVSKSECRIMDNYKDPLDPHMFERQMGDTQQNRTKYRNGADILGDVMNGNNLYYNEKLDQTVRSQNSSAVSDSEETLTCTPTETQLDLRNTLNAPEAFYSSEEEEDV